MKLSVCVITYNAEPVIARCLQSVQAIADEIIVVDSGSLDDTKEIVCNFTEHFFVNAWGGFGPQKNFAASLAKAKWILSIDADEVLSPSLRDEILDVISRKGEGSAYQMPRLAFFWGKPIWHGGWYPDRVCRLYKKEKAHWSEDLVHEKLLVEGEIKKLKSNLLHYTDGTVLQRVQKIWRYAELGADRDEKKGKRFSLLQMVLCPPLKFCEMFFLKNGWKDGLAGFVLAVLGSFGTFLKIANLWEKERNMRNNKKTGPTLFVGLTGGVGSGKTTVGEMLRSSDIEVVDTDQISHQIMKPGELVFGAILSEFGEGILTKEGEIDRRQLAEIVFADPKCRVRLEAITHPAIYQEVFLRFEEAKQRKVCCFVVEATLIYETGMERELDFVIVVSATAEQQRERTKGMRHYSETFVGKVLAAQMPLPEKAKRADFVIDNSKDLAFTKNQVEKLRQRLLQFQKRDSIP